MLCPHDDDDDWGCAGGDAEDPLVAGEDAAELPVAVYRHILLRMYLAIPPPAQLKIQIQYVFKIQIRIIHNTPRYPAYCDPLVV